MVRFLAVWLLFPATLVAQDYEWDVVPKQDFHDAVVEIESVDAMGTGVFVDIKGDRAWILTVFHVVDSDGGANNIVVKFVNGESFKAKLLRWSIDLDVALLECALPNDISPVAVADAGQGAVGGDVLHAVGLGGGVGIASDEVRRFQFKVATYDCPRYILADTAVVPGDSGGPIFKDGKVVGLIAAGAYNRKGWHPFEQPYYWGLMGVELESMRLLLDN